MFTFSAAAGWFDGDPYQKYYTAARNGFKAMEELWWIDKDVARIRDAIDGSGCCASAILFQSSCEKDAALIANTHGMVWEDARDAVSRAVEETLKAALKLNCRNIVVTTGNERSDVSRYVQHTNIVLALRQAAEVVKGSGVTLVLEPLNIIVNHKGYYLVTTAESVDVIKEVNAPEVKLLYDVYHQQISEGNVIYNIRNNIADIGHIHVGDVPGRKEPGTGELNYRNIFQAIADEGYEGFVTFECGRSKDAETVCREMLALTPR